MESKKLIDENIPQNRLTLVSFLYDLSRKENNFKRKTIEEYLSLGEKLLKINLPLIIYTEEDLGKKILNRRKELNLDHITKIIIIPFEQLYYYKNIVKIKECRKIHPVFNSSQTKDSILYTMLMWHKFWAINNSIDLNPFNTSHFAWIDFGLFHAAKYEKYQDAFEISNIPDKIKLLLMKCFKKEDIIFDPNFYDIFRGNVCSGYITANIEYWKKFYYIFEKEINYSLNNYYAPSDEQLITKCLAKNLELFELSFGDYYSCLSNYKYIYYDLDLILWSLKISIETKGYYTGLKLCENLEKSIKNNTIKLNLEQENYYKENYEICKIKLFSK